jgi:hypothetical protein
LVSTPIIDHRGVQRLSGRRPRSGISTMIVSTYTRFVLTEHASTCSSTAHKLGALLGRKSPTETRSPFSALDGMTARSMNRIAPLADAIERAGTASGEVQHAA